MERPAVAFSHLNVADPRFAELRMFRPSSVGEFAQECATPYVEWCAGLVDVAAPTRQIVRATEQGALRLASLRAPFRESKYIQGVNEAVEAKGRSWAPARAHRLLSGPVGRMLLGRDIQGGAQAMEDIQQGLGGPLPCVMYPLPDRRQDDCMRERNPSGIKLFQVTDYVAKLFESTSLTDFATSDRLKAYDGVVIDMAPYSPRTI